MSINITAKQTHTWQPDIWGNLDMPDAERFSITFTEITPLESVPLSEVGIKAQVGNGDAILELVGVYLSHIVCINNLAETVDGESVLITDPKRFLDLCGPQLFNLLCAKMANPVSEDKLKNSEAPSSGS